MEDVNLHYTKLQHIDEAYWLKTMEHYPETVEQLKLLVTIMDKMGIFEKFDLCQTSQMDGDKLNVLYAILRIMNKAFNKYLDHTVRKIFKNHLETIFVCTHLGYYDIFFDQLVQDIDNFVCYILHPPHNSLSEIVIFNKLVKYLEQLFKKKFYQDITKKLGYRLDKSFFAKNNEILQSIIEDFLAYTNETLMEIYQIMIMFLEKIFSKECQNETVQEIINTLEKYIDLAGLFREECMEIEIYCEQKIGDEMEYLQKMDRNKISNICQNFN